MSKAIIEAILATAEGVPHLGKSEHNKHGGFSYVGIDTFYERVASVARKNGLTWLAREMDAVIEEVIGGKGPVSALLATYDFDLFHRDGDKWISAFKITIIHPLQGAQTAGSAMSYAEKQFMREAFKVVTGEADADATDNKVFEPEGSGDAFDMGVKSKAVAPSMKFTAPDVALNDLSAADKALHLAAEDSEGGIEALTIAFLPLAKTERQLTEYWTKNAAELKLLQDGSPGAYARVVDAFKARKAELKKDK